MCSYGWRATVSTATRPSLDALVRQSYQTMTPTEPRRISAMYGSTLGLHLVDFTIFVAFVIPAHYRGLGIGVSVLAYTLGLRHAFDADHIAVIDNTTLFGTLVSATFLFLIGSLNLVILGGISKVFRAITTDGIVMNLAYGWAFLTPSARSTTTSRLPVCPWRSASWSAGSRRSG